MKYILFFDGGCRKIEGVKTAVAAWVLERDDGTEVAGGRLAVATGVDATNNVAEWAALRNGLQQVATMFPGCDLEIRGDSQLVIYQLDGTYQCRKPTLQTYLHECAGLLAGLKSWDAKWVPRSENKKADALGRFMAI